MQLEIITPDQTLFSGEAEVITLPGIDGSFQILNNHAPMIAGLKGGTVRVKAEGNEENFPITGGIVEVLNNKAIVLA
jgi:F-type H+-transporting ATPase subunit epsilon